MRSCIVLTSFLLERVNSKAIITYHTGEVYQNLTRNAMRRGGDCATSRHAAGRIGVDQNELVLQKTGLDTFSLNQGVQGSSPWRCIRSPGIREKGVQGRVRRIVFAQDLGFPPTLRRAQGAP